jgi:hypothetical protein
MKQVYRIDSQGYFIEPVTLDPGEPLPPDCVDVEMPDGLYKPRYVNGIFVSSISKEEYVASLPAETPSESEVVGQRIVDLEIRLMVGGF